MKTKKNRAKMRTLDSMSVEEAIQMFSIRKHTQKIQLLKPFMVMPATSYSNPITLPIGVAYLASIMELAGYEVDIIDGVGELPMNIESTEDSAFKRQGLSPEMIVERVDPECTLLGISLMFSQEWPEYRKLVKRIKSTYPNLTIVAGGEHATALPEFVLQNCPEIDYLVLGEGELTFLRLVHDLNNDNYPDKSPGIAWLDKEGNYLSSGLGQRIADFKNLPRPAWHLCPVENYFSKAFSFGLSYGRNMPILATRGCPYQCTFCSNPVMWTPRYVMRDVEDLIDEIEDLISTYDCNSVDFADLTAIVKKQWILDFCTELTKRKLNIVWQLPTGTRAEALDYETLGAIYNAGCRLVVYAPESGSKETLVAIQKKLNLDKLLESAKTASKIGHMTKVNFILGFPGEDRSSMWKTLGCAMKNALNGVGDCNITIFAPYPGSQLFQELMDSGHLDLSTDEYFENLGAFFDFTNCTNYSGTVSNFEIGLYRIGGLALFYILSYLTSPRKRLWKLVESVFRKDFQPTSLFEQRVYDFTVRAK